MTFHRLTTPSYSGGLRGGDDYINNEGGTPAPVDTALGAGPYAGSYFFALNDQVTGPALNRAAQALAENCDFLDDAIVQMALDYAAADAAVLAAAEAYTDIESAYRIRERSTITVIGAPAPASGHFPVTLTADMCLLELRANETAELNGEINLPDPATCLGRKFLLYEGNGNGCTLVATGGAVFLNIANGGGTYGCISDNTHYVMGNGDDRQYEWFTPDGVNWLVSSRDGTPTFGL